MPGINTISEGSSISLITSSRSDNAHYHLMELTPDMVHFFEAPEGSLGRGVKRTREEGDAGIDEERDYHR
jgi:hypothetical protein